MSQKQQFNPDDQIVVTGRIENNGVGSEVIKFPIRLGPFHLFVIVNVPGEGETEAPVYVKMRVSIGEKPTSPEVHMVRPKKSRREVGTFVDHGTETI